MSTKNKAAVDVEQAFANALQHEPASGNNVPNQEYFANETRFIEANFSEPLTAYAVGWKDPNNIENTLNFVAPPVPTNRRFEWARATNAEEFYTESDDVRAIGSEFKRVEFTSDKVNDKTDNKGLTIRVDMDNIDVKNNPMWAEQYVARLIRRLLRNDLRRAITLLAAAGTNTAVTWSTAAGKDPDQDVAQMVIDFADAVGMNPTRLLYGTGAWNKRRLSHRAQNSAGGFASAMQTVDEVAATLGFDRGLVSKERYQSSHTAKTKVVGDIVLAYLANDQMTTEDPSNIKRFVSNTISGGPLRVYQQQVGAKFWDITVEHYSKIVVTSSLGVQKLTVS